MTKERWKTSYRGAQNHFKEQTTKQNKKTTVRFLMTTKKIQGAKMLDRCRKDIE